MEHVHDMFGLLVLPITLPHSILIKLLKDVKLKKGGGGVIRPSNRDEDVEDTDHDAPFRSNKEVPYDGGSNRGIAGFPDADQASQQGQKPELLHQSRQKHGSNLSMLLISASHSYTHQSEVNHTRDKCQESSFSAIKIYDIRPQTSLLLQFILWQNISCE